MADKPNLPCCLFASDEEVETDAQEFDCQACPVRDHLDGLWPENRAAWTLYQRIVNRLTYDCGLIGSLFESAVQGADFEERVELMQRLAIIYDALVPVSAPKES